jgi:hypothetical protein
LPDLAGMKRGHVPLELRAVTKLVHIFDDFIKGDQAQDA